MDGSGKTNMGLYEKNNQEESKHQNNQNAEVNYKRLLKHQEHIKDGVSMKIHNGRYDNIYNPTTDENEMLWTVTEPIYVMFSWKDKRDNNCSLPLSFHIDTNKFEESLNKFIKPKYREQKVYQSYYV